MASAMDSSKGEVTLVGLEVTCNLSGVHVWLPVDGGLPVKRGNPVLGANGWNGTIGISRVVEHSNLALKCFVDPLGSLWLNGVGPVLASAKIPSLNIVGNMECLSDNIQVKVVEKTGSVGAGWEISEHVVTRSGWSLEPWSVFVLSPSSFLVGLVELWEWTRSPAGSEDVVNVDIRDNGVELVEVGKTFIGCLLHVWATEVTLGVGNLVVELRVHKRVPVGHIEESSGRVVVPVGDTVADHESLKRWLEDIIVLSIALVVLVNVIGEVWDVNSGVGLTRNVKIVSLEIWEFLVPFENDGQVILSRGLVIECAVLLGATIRESDTCWLFNVEDIGFTVPAISTGMNFSGSTVHSEWTVFLHETKH